MGELFGMEQKHCVYCMRANTDDKCLECGKRTSEYVAAPHHLSPGTILNNKYKVGAVLGEGGFGITYVGRDTKLDLRIAIKEYFPSGIVNRNNTASNEITAHYGDAQSYFEKGKKSFLEEARTLAKFSNDPNIVSVRDFFEENNTAYIVMEYLEGMDLKDYLSSKGVMTFNDAFQLLSPIMTSLSKVHKYGLIHRDISPANIMVLNDGVVKLLDFGAAREVDGADEKSLSILLKPGYAPEEQYRTRGKQGPWTDVYALSATIYKLITGVTPEDAMNRIFEDSLVKPSSINPDLTSIQDNVLLKGMGVHQENRFQSMDELQQACNNALKDAHQESSVLWDGESTISGEQYFGMKHGITSVHVRKGIVDNSSKTDNKKQDLSEQDIKKEVPSIDAKNEPTQKKPNIIYFIFSILTGLITLYTMFSFAGNLAEKDRAGSTVVSAIVMTMFATATFFLGKPFYSRLNNKTRKPNVFCLVCSIISTVLVALCTWITSRVFAGSSEPGVKATSIALVLAALIIAVFFGYFYYPRLNRKKRSIALKIHGGIIAIAVTIFVISLVFMSLNTITIGDEKIDRSATSVSLSFDIINDNDLAKLKQLKNLEVLEIQECFMDDNDVKLIGELTQLKKLSLWLNTDITDVSPLNSLRNLTSLNLEKTNIKDISCLSDLTKLEYLNINGTKVVDISIVEKYTSLKQLCMNSLSELDCSTIKLPESLSSLECSGNGIKDLSFIEGTNSLTYLIASNNNISDISSMGKFENINTVDFSNNSIKDISPVCKTGIYSLSFNNNQIENISALNGVKAYTVKLSHNKISDISAFTDNSNIGILDLSNNQIVNISALKDCFKIFSLDLSYNLIEDITAIATIDKLSILNLRGNSIVDISPLGKARELVNTESTLDLRDNRIGGIQALSSFKNVTQIYLSNNNISDITPLASCNSLKFLLLNGNNVSDISSLSTLKQLNHLEIVSNPVNDLSSISLNPTSGIFGDSSLRVSYSESIDWAALKNVEKLSVTIYDVPERQKEALMKLGFKSFGVSSELDNEDSENKEGDNNG